MFNALVLVRNLKSHQQNLDFGEFRISLVGQRFKELRKIFSSVDVNQDDWVLEKNYSQLPSGPPGSPVGGIPNDIEDILLLLRLFKTGDVSFVRQAIIPPNGHTLVQFPYRAMNDLNSYSTLRFEAQPDDCSLWQAFASSVRGSQSWNSDWWAAARRFFLSGGAKQFSPRWDDLDRILDYTTALEASLVPERDYNARRLTRRAAALLELANPVESHGITTFLKRFYEIRSRIVHGSGVGEENRKWLFENSSRVESLIRQLLTAAVLSLPAEDNDRRAFLSRLYDPTDEDRGSFVLDKFREIKTESVRKAIAEKIVKFAAR